MTRQFFCRGSLAAMLLAAAAPGPAAGASAAGELPSSAQLAELSLEDLGNISITSVSRRTEKLSQAAASIFVITAEDIRRSGASSLPEALRLAPNLQVARVNTGQYAVSARGFNNAIGNKLLVLIDGRTVYTPQFSGVNWDSQFVMLEDVERIEVISGPGATLWGANAVNGVINVITRPAHSTQGALVSAAGGKLESGASARVGARVGGVAYRVYGVGYERDNTRLATGAAVKDGWRSAQAGFRADWGDADRTLTVQGDGYRASSDPGPLGRAKLSGANLLARWKRQVAGGSSWHVQAYYDRAVRDDPLTYRDAVDLFDLELHHAFAPAPGHNVLWGGGYRYAVDEAETHFNAFNPLPQVFMPARRTLRWSNLFVQDEVALGPRLKATVGMKVETNVYTGAEFLPSARLAWTPADDKLVWGALSRAVRAPARIDRDFFLFLQLPGIPLIPVINGGPDFESEIAYVAEAGYRAHLSSTVSYSATAFYSYYDKLRSGQPPPAVVQNMMHGSTYGLEAWASFQATRDWRLSAGMTALNQDLRVEPGSLDPTGPSALGNDPKFQWMLRSSMNLSSAHELDLILRHVGKLPDPAVPAYTALGLRLGWRPRRDLELSVVAQAAFGGRHVEFGAPANASQIDRGVFLKAVWRP